MKKTKRFFSACLAACLLAGSTVGCNNAPAETVSQSDSTSQETGNPNMDGDVQLSDPGEFPIVVGEPVTLSVFTSPQVDEHSKFDAADNEFTAWLEEKLNIKLEWTVVSSADKTAKLNLLFNSNDYQDIIMNSGWDAATIYTYGTQGFLLPLNDYLETDAYYQDIYVQTGLDNGTLTQSSVDSLVMPDGNIYALGKYSAAVHSLVAARMWIYQPWLDALDLEMPTTTEEYYEVLKAFKENDPNGNGIADEIPLTGSTKGWNNNPMDFIMNSFVCYGGVNGQNRAYVEDGTVQLAYMQEGYKEGLKYLNRLYAEGLLLPDTWTQDQTQLKSLTVQETQLVGSVPGGAYAAFTQITNGEEGDWLNWKVVPPLEGPEGVQYAEYFPQYPLSNFLITDACEYPRVAFRLGDALYEEVITVSAKQGLQGKYWDYAEQGDVGLDGNPAIYKVIMFDANSTETNFAWGQMSNACEMPGWHTGQAVVGDPAMDNEALLYQAAQSYLEYVPDEDMILPPLIYSEEDSKTVVDLTTSLNEYIDQSYVDFITNGNIDEKWDVYLQELNARGVETLRSLYQKAYEERTAVSGD